MNLSVRLAAIAVLVTTPRWVGAATSNFTTKLYYGVVTDEVVRRTNLDGSAQEDLYETPGGARIDIAVDALEQQIYFPSNEAGGIMRSSLEGSNPQLAVAVPTTTQISINTLTVDSANRKIYWSDSAPDRLSETPTGASDIWRSNLDGSDRELLAEGLPRITAIEVDPAHDCFYWADFYTGAIRRTTLDNSHTDVIFDEHTFGIVPEPTGLAVDPIGGYLYASDIALQAIVRMGLDGSNPVELVDGIAVRNSPTIALDPVGQRLYWANWTGYYNTHSLFDKHIMSAKLDGSDVRREFYVHNQRNLQPMYVVNLAVVQVPVPEPATAALAGLGGLLMLAVNEITCRRTRRPTRNS
jgi:sugar lactone lactonase YvrE